MITRSQKRAKHLPQKAFWLDDLPVDVRAKIANLATNGGTFTDAALNLAHTSELQQEAVLESFPPTKTYTFDLNNLHFSEGWATLLEGRTRIVDVFAGDRMNLPGRVQNHAPLLRILRAPQLTDVSVPGFASFLVSIRHSKALSVLSINMFHCSYRSLVSTLRQVGQSLSKLYLLCSDCGPSNTGWKSPGDCPMKLCHGKGPNALTLLCPNLTSIDLHCPHLQRSTLSPLASGLPLLRSVSYGSPYDTIELSEEDIVVLRRLDNVELGNVSGAVMVAARIGRPVSRLFYVHPDVYDTSSELAKCPQLSKMFMQIEISELQGFRNVVPQLPKLTFLVLLIGLCLSFEDYEHAVVEAVKILHICDHPLEQISLIGSVPVLEWPSRAEKMNRISSIAAREGGKLNYTDAECPSIQSVLTLLEDGLCS